MKTAAKCAALSIAFSLPMAFAFALLFRFPIPLGGYIGPVSDIGIDYSRMFEIVKIVSIAWVFYGILGGFIVLPFGGVIVSKLTSYIGKESESKRGLNLIYPAVFVSFLGCGTLAVLDYIIGPW